MTSATPEIELKISPRDGRDARGLLEALGASARNLRSVPVRDVYYDTEDRALLAAGFGFRLRTKPDGSREATLKSFARADGQGVTEREEETAPFPAAKPDPRLLPDGPMRTTVEAAAAGAPLVPLAHVTGTRRVATLEPRSGLRVEIAHDRVKLTAGDESRHDEEIEVELLAGPAHEFRAWLKERLRGLRPRASRGSKLERALRVARVRLPTPQRMAAARLGLGAAADERATASTAAAQSLARLALALGRALDSARRGGVEGVHDVRTVSRRLRAVLSTFRDEVPDARRRELRQRLAALRRAAGPVRDLDIVRDAIASAGKFGSAESEGEATGLASIKEALALRRRRERAALSVALAAPRLRDLADRVAEAAAATLAQHAASSPFPVAGASRMPGAVEHMLARRAAIPGALADAPSAALHALRIASKRARYGAEVFAPAFGKTVARFAASARELQDALGVVQDAVAIADAVRSVLAAVPRPRRPAAARAAAALVSACEKKARKARGRIDDAAAAVCSPKALRSLFDHVAKRASAVVNGSS